MKLRRALLSLILLVLFPGCSAGPTVIPSTASPVPFTSTVKPSATATADPTAKRVFRSTDTPKPTLPAPTKYPTRTSTATITPRPTFTPRAGTPVPLEGLEAISLTNFQQMELVSQFFLGYENLKGVNQFNPEAVFSPDSRFLAFMDENRVVLWNINQQQIERTFTGPDWLTFSWGSRPAFSPNGRYLATTWYEGPIVWDVQTGETILIARAPIKDNQFTDMSNFQDYTDLVFTGDGRQIITSSYFAGTSLTYWDLQTGKILKQTYPTGNGIHDLDLSPDGRTVFAAVRGGLVNFFNAATGERLIHPIEGLCWETGDCPEAYVCGESADEVELTPNGKILAVRCRPNDEEFLYPECTSPNNQSTKDYQRSFCYSTKLFSTETWKLLGYLSDITPTLDSVTFNSDGGIAAQAEGRPATQVKLWNTMTREEIHTLDDFPGEIAQVRFSPNGQLLLVRMIGGEVVLYGVRGE